MCLATLSTGYGTWSPLIWLLLFALLIAVAYAIRAFGERGFKEGTGRDEPFMSGNDVPDDLHIRGSNLYWGYLEALKGYYEKLVPLHTGVLSDYVLWLFGVLALVLVIGWMA